MSHKHRDFSIKMSHKLGDIFQRRLFYRQMPHKHGDFSIPKCFKNMETFL